MKNIFVILGTLLLVLVLAYVFHINRVTREGLTRGQVNVEERGGGYKVFTDPATGDQVLMSPDGKVVASNRGVPDRPNKPGTGPGTEPPPVDRSSKPGTEPAKPGTEPAKPGTEPVEPGTKPVGHYDNVPGEPGTVGGATQVAVGPVDPSAGYGVTGAPPSE